VTEQNETVAKVRLTAPFEEMMASIPGETVQTLDVQRVRGPSGILSLLGIPAGGEMVRVRRIRSRGNQPLSYAIGYIPPALAASLHPEDLSTKPLLIDTLEQKAGVLFREVNQTIDASLASDETATALQVPLGSPVLLVQRRYELESGKCGFVAVDYYPSPSVRYEIRLVREDRSRRDWQIRTDLGRASSDAT
jgi:GntR family transcriptional regulator